MLNLFQHLLLMRFRNKFGMTLTESEPLKIKIASRQEYKTDFLFAGDRFDFEGLFLVIIGMRELDYLS